MSDALKEYTNAVDNTPQSAPIPGSTQVPNSAGGYSWEVDKWAKLHRFLILGTDGGTYYINQEKLTADNAAAVINCLNDDWMRTVDEIVKISEAGRAPKNDQALFALAMASAARFNAAPHGRSYALSQLPKVARTFTHLAQFANYVSAFRGEGRALRTAYANWFEQKDPNHVAYQVIKYRNREGWTPRDLLRVAHPQGASLAHKSIYEWVTNREKWLDNIQLDINLHIAGFERAQAVKTETELVKVLEEYPSLPHEALPTEFKNKPAVVEALLANGMPIGALVRNLATYTRAGVLNPGSIAEGIVLAQLANREAVQKSRIHPISALKALLVYSNGDHFGTKYAYGYSAKGKEVENPNSRIIDALDDLFYLAFDNVEPTGKTHLLALDVSGSMGYPDNLAGAPGLTPALGAAAMALVTAKSGDPYLIYGFSTSFRRIDITARDRLTDALNKTKRMTMGGTDCALPMKWAKSNNTNVDVFAVYTDSETWAGTPHPAQALKNYRKAVNSTARLAVVAMVSNPFSIADPNDAGMVDLVGFDTSTPAILSEFAKGSL